MQHVVTLIKHFINAFHRPSNDTRKDTYSFHVGTHVGRMLGACGGACGAHESGGGRDEKEKSKRE